MKKILLLAVLALALPTAMFAGSSVDYTNSGGTLSGSSAGLSLSGSVLIAVNGLNGGGLITGSDLGSVSFYNRCARLAVPCKWAARSQVVGCSPSPETAPTESRTELCSQEVFRRSGDLDAGDSGQRNA